MKIYDCFTFYNELDLLEIRLNELYDYVDHFVIVEANATFTNKLKTYVYEKAKARFSRFADKIIHVKVIDMPMSKDAWVNDRYQRDQIFRGIEHADPDDLIIVSDLDEIIRPAAIEYMRASKNTLFPIRMPLFNFKFNYMRSEVEPYVVWGMAGRRHLFDHIKPDAFRALRFNYFTVPFQYTLADTEVIEHGGWHFGYMGNNEWLKDKAASFAHQEINYPEFVNNIDVDKSIANRMHWGNFGPERYTIVELDDYFPKHIVDNTERYKDWILAGTEGKVLDLLPRYPYNN